MAIHKDVQGTNRDDMLRFGTAGMLGLTLPRFLATRRPVRRGGPGLDQRRPGQEGRVGIMVWCRAAPEDIEMWT